MRRAPPTSRGASPPEPCPGRTEHYGKSPIYSGVRVSGGVRPLFQVKLSRSLNSTRPWQELGRHISEPPVDSDGHATTASTSRHAGRGVRTLSAALSIAIAD